MRRFIGLAYVKSRLERAGAVAVDDRGTPYPRTRAIDYALGAGTLRYEAISPVDPGIPPTATAFRVLVPTTRGNWKYKFGGIMGKPNEKEWVYLDSLDAAIRGCLDAKYPMIQVRNPDGKPLFMSVKFNHGGRSMRKFASLEMVSYPFALDDEAGVHTCYTDCWIGETNDPEHMSMIETAYAGELPPNLLAEIMMDVGGDRADEVYQSAGKPFTTFGDL